MPVTAMLVALVAGLAVWGVLDQVQSRQVGKIFSQELESQLHLQARESLIRFDRYLDTYGTTTRLLANHRRLAEYLEPLFWSENTAVEPVIYQEFRPFWLPDFFGRDALRAPSHVLLVDTKGRVREVFQAGSEALPEDLRSVVSPQFLDPSAVRLVPVRFGEQLYLLISDAVEDSGGYPMGHLVVLLAIDDAFMAASQRGIDPSRAAVALVDGDDQRILASLDSATLIPGTSLDLWTDGYLVTSQSLTGYEGTDTNLLFATFVPQTIVERMQRHVRIFERRQRFYAALAFILVFTGVIYLVSARLNQVLKRMTRFSQRALGIVEPGFAPGGNQLLLLEEWIKHFTELVLAAREEMNRRHQAEMRESEALKAAMMEASLDSIVTLDHEGRIVEVNPAAERAFGLSRGDAMGLSFAERFLPDGSRAAFLRLLERAGHSELEPQGRGELGALRADGREFPVEISIVPIGSDSERFHTLYIHDVTSRKQAEREIKSLARFVAESPNPILRVTASGVVAYANNASQPLLAAWGIERGEPLPQEWAGEVLEAMERGEPREREIDLAGQVFALLFAPIRDLGYANIYARDITAVRRAEQQSRQHQAELVHVSRLSTMGEVATGMAHELNQPLSAIVNYANGCSRRIQNGVGDSAELLGAPGPGQEPGPAGGGDHPPAARAGGQAAADSHRWGSQRPGAGGVRFPRVRDRQAGHPDRAGARSRAHTRARRPGPDRAGAAEPGAQRTRRPGGRARGSSLPDHPHRLGRRGACHGERRGHRTRRGPGGTPPALRSLLHHQTRRDGDGACDQPDHRREPRRADLGRVRAPPGHRLSRDPAPGAGASAPDRIRRGRGR